MMGKPMRGRRRLQMIRDLTNVMAMRHSSELLKRDGDAVE